MVRGWPSCASRPITDPQLLEQIRTSDEGRGHRGIEELRHELAAVDRRTPAGRVKVMQLEIFLGLLHMLFGEFTDADSRFAAAQVADPNCPLQAAGEHRGLARVAALRRGETGKLRRVLQRLEVHFSAGAGRRFIRAPPARARRSAALPPPSSSDPKIWASSGS